jgi:hypothetical protein
MQTRVSHYLACSSAEYNEDGRYDMAVAIRRDCGSPRSSDGDDGSECDSR